MFPLFPALEEAGRGDRLPFICHKLDQDEGEAGEDGGYDKGDAVANRLVEDHADGGSHSHSQGVHHAGQMPMPEPILSGGRRRENQVDIELEQREKPMPFTIRKKRTIKGLTESR